MPNTRTKTSLSEKDIEDIKKSTAYLQTYMCDIVENVHSPTAEHGCELSKDIREFVHGLTHEKTTHDDIEKIDTILDEMRYIAISIEAGADNTLRNIIKTNRHFNRVLLKIRSPVGFGEQP